jgi:hypothetical protein
MMPAGSREQRMLEAIGVVAVIAFIAISAAQRANR